MIRNKRLVFLLGAISLLYGTEPLAAQDSVTIAIGRRVRVTAPTVSQKSITGNVKVFDSVLVIYSVIDSHVNRRKDTVLTSFRLDEISKLELSQGTRRRYIATGALCGTLAGLMTSSIGGSACKSSGFADFSCLGWLAAIPAGLIVGTTIGIIVSGERWERVDLHRAQLGVSMIDRRSPGVRLSLSF